MFDLIEELLMNRFGLFLLGVVLMGGGIYVWTGHHRDTTAFDLASGPESQEGQAEIVGKGTEGFSVSEVEHEEHFLQVRYEGNGKERMSKVYVDSKEYDRAVLGQTISVRYHESNPEYVLTPEMQRPSTLWTTLATLGLIGAGLLIVVVIVISLFV